MTQGGILPAIPGTVLLTFITTFFSVPFGVACAIYLNEYAKPSPLTNIIRASIRNLTGVPSIIYGLFGLASPDKVREVFVYHPQEVIFPRSNRSPKGNVITKRYQGE